ncbi:MAG: hypothetical protein ACE5PT_05630 [Gemmatimonadales bacterium]
MIDLPARPVVSTGWHARLCRLGGRTASHPPRDLATAVREEIGVDLTARYGGLTIPHPIGKASGQLSCTANQVATDVRAGIAFVVLKTVIAESPGGARSMEQWALPEARMRVGRRIAPDGREGWTVTWKGRGWSGTLSQYLDFFAESLGLAREGEVPVIPSVKYHLPAVGESVRESEYRYTTRQLLEVWKRSGCSGTMVLEKDFSPTLAGDPRAARRETVLGWLEKVPGLIDRSAPGETLIGVKLMNSLFDDQFQVEMVRALVERAETPPAFLVVFNRLFDAERGVAYGGWELSDRNLRVLELLREAEPPLQSMPPLSGTGNICSGKVMVQYALAGCESGQVHTFFQVPLSEYTATGGSRTARALHTLLLHPTEGLVVWLRHLYETDVLGERDGEIRFLDAVGLGTARR